jgi:Cu(I)/Ag(I) efflux system membrane protein CusA/SilA
MNFYVLGVNLRDLFNMGPMNLSIAVWVGFLALFGIATDDGVIMGTRLQQVFRERQPDSVADIRAATLAAAQLRIKACVMTSATTIIALLPVLSASGRGADIMVPMAIPSVGGMLAVLLSLFVVPTLYCLHEEWLLKRRIR